MTHSELGSLLTVNGYLCLAGIANEYASAQQRCIGVAFKAGGAAVLDVEHAGHLVTVFRLETTTGEANLLDHIGVDDAETFLLSRADQQWSINLYIVDIYGVLVK